MNGIVNEPSTRAAVITRRTYSRPLDESGNVFETWEQTVARVIDHQKWLWERALGGKLKKKDEEELLAFELLMLQRKVSVSGRTLWLGGTDVAKTREASNFNCSFLNVETVFDVVDGLWLLLQGCGLGFRPITGTLNGFSKPIKIIEVIKSTRTEKGGNEHNSETWDAATKTWTIAIGDSAESWAKSIGKLLAGKYAANKLVLDFSAIRPSGERLKGYGWISSGDDAISKAYVSISELMNKRAGSLLTAMDVLDIMNHLGTVLSSRRSAEIAILEADHPEWREFATAKKEFWLHDNLHRCQSNNSLIFYSKPKRSKLKEVFDLMIDSGGSEPGFINGEAALKRAPWFKGVNPCCEILLGNKSFCNLSEIDVGKFHGDSSGLREAIVLTARANYRQTCVNLKDGVLQEAWHLNNEFLRLCGVGLTGIARRNDLGAYDYQELQRVATSAAYSMADELGTAYPKNICTVKPSGCRPWNALTSTTGGILTLEELLSEHTLNDEWCDYTGGLSVLQDGEENKIIKTYNNGLAEVFEVRMNHGLIVESTADHPWFVTSRYVRGGVKNIYKPVNMWVKTSDLTKNDVIEVCPGIYKSERHSPLIKLNSLSLKMRNDASEIAQPIEMNEDLAWLLGYLWGDGCMSPMGYRLRWTDQHVAHLEKTKKILFEQFNLVAPINKSSQNRDCYNLEIGSKMLWHWLLKNGISKYDADQLDLIPRVVRESSASDIAGFIAGLVDSDGCIGIDKKSQKRNVMICSADKRFIKHVQDVGWSIGLAFGMSHNQLGQNLQKRKSMYITTLSVHTLPNALEMLNRNSCKMQSETRGDFWSGENGSNLNGYTVGKVKTVLSLGEMPTYDIEVENNHWYYAGAVKSHNTLSKLMDTTEGVHKPLGRYIFNNVNFSKHDPIVKKMKESGYKVIKNPADNESMLVTFPVAWDDVEFSTVDGVEVNIESAVSQLDKYKLLQNNWTQQNTSVTISYDVSEVDAILDWLIVNWDLYVGVSFIYRTDPTKTAADLGYLYLPQEVVTKETYDEYVAKLLEVDIDGSNSFEEITDAECAGGMCPVK